MGLNQFSDQVNMNNPLHKVLLIGYLKKKNLLIDARVRRSGGNKWDFVVHFGK